MSPKRAYIFWVFLIASLPLGACVLAYASGYRIDKDSRSIIHTSALSISTTPGNASIDINDTAIENTTPYIGTLPPGTYAIHLSKEGYHDWRTTVSITETESALLDNIVLFPTTTPLLIAQRSAPLEQFAPIDAEYFTALNLSGFSESASVTILPGVVDMVIDPVKKIYALVNPTTHKLITQRSGDVVSAQWSDRNSLLIATTNEIFMFTPRTEAFDLVTRQSAPILSATWHPMSTHILFADADGLYAIESFAHDHDIRTTLLLHSGIRDLSINTKTRELEFTLNNELFSLVIE